jgi:PPOX class probable F420-dependent enzyme
MTIEFITMESDEIDAFLADTRHAVIGTNRVDGSPQLSPVWYLHRDGKIYTSVYDNSAKSFNLRRDPRVTVCVDGTYPDSRYVVIYGTVEFYREQSAWRDEIDRAIALRYHETVDQAENYLRETSGPGGVLLIITPQKILSGDYN